MHQTKQVMVEDTGFLKPRRLRSLSEKKQEAARQVEHVPRQVFNWHNGNEDNRDPLGLTFTAVIQAATVFTISPLGLKLPEGLAELHWSRKAHTGVCGGNRRCGKKGRMRMPSPSSPALSPVHYPARLHSPEVLEPYPLPYHVSCLA